VRWRRRAILGFVGLVLATIAAFIWPKSESNSMVVFRNASEWAVTIVHDKQNRDKRYIGQAERATVAPDGFAPFQFEQGDVFFAAYADEVFNRNAETTARLDTTAIGEEYVEIRADQDDALQFVTGLGWPDVP